MIAVVGDLPLVAAYWGVPLGLLFIDGGHGVEPARLDYAGWTPHVARGGRLVIHDVFPDLADGGRPPYEEIYLPALRSGHFVEVTAARSASSSAPSTGAARPEPRAGAGAGSVARAVARRGVLLGVEHHREQVVVAR